MSGLPCIIALLSKFFPELGIISLNLFKPGRRKHLSILTHLASSEGKQLAHLESYVEQLLVYKLCGVSLAVLLMDVLQISFQVSKLVFVSTWAKWRSRFTSRAATNVLHHRIDLRFDL